MLGFLTNCIELLLNPKFTIPVIGGVVGFFILLHLLWKISDMAEQKREEKTSETYTDLLSDDVLNKRLDPPMKIFEPISFSPDIELTLTPFQSTPTKEQPMISEEEYISQLENLYREHGNNAFHYVTRIQEQTGYSKDKIKADLG